MKGLVGYHLINIAAFRNSSCEIDGHFQFIGTNGNGKTTNLRVPLYFYNPSSDKRDHAIESSKSPFNDFYFNKERSYIVFEVCRDILPDGRQDLYHIAVNRTGKRPPKFTFINAPYNKDYFLTPTGAIVNDRELRGNLHLAQITFEEINRYQDFRGIIYGNSFAERFRPFVFAEPKASGEKYIKTIPNILSAIFRSENMKTGELKDALIASLGDEEAYIDLNSTGRQLRDFQGKRRDLMNLEQEVPRISHIVGAFSEMKERRAEMDYYGYQIRSCIPKVELSLKVEGAAYRDAADKRERGKQDYEESQAALSDTLEKLNLEIGGLEADLNSIREKQKAYPKAQIEEWEKDEKELPILEQKKHHFESVRNALNDQAGEIEKRYAQLLENDRLGYSKLREAAQASYNQAIQELNSQKEQVQDDYVQQLQELQDYYSNEETEIKSSILSGTKKTTALQKDLENLSLENVRKAEFAQLRERTHKLERDELKNDQQHNGLLPKKQGIEARHTLALAKLREKYEPELADLEKQQSILQAAISKQQAIVDKYEHSLLEFVDDHSQLGSVFRTILNENILLLPAEQVLEPDATLQDTGVYGLKLKHEKLPEPPSLDYEQAILALAEKQKNHDELISEIEKCNLSKKAEAGQINEAKEAELSSYNDLSNSVRTERIRINNLKAELEDLQAREETCRQEEYERSKVELETRFAEETEALRASEERSLKINEEKRSKQADLNRTRDKSISKLDEKKGKVIEQRDQVIKTADSNEEASKKKINQQMQNEMKAGAVSEEEMDKAQRDFSSVSIKVDKAQKSKDTLDYYRNWEYPTIVRLPEVEEKLDSAKKQRGQVKKQAQQAKQQWEKIDTELSQKYKLHKEQHDTAEKDMEEIKFWDDGTESFYPEEKIPEPVFNYSPGDGQAKIKKYNSAEYAMKELWDGEEDSASKDFHHKGIDVNVREIVKLFKDDNLFNFPLHFTYNDEIERFIDNHLEPILTNNALEREKLAVLDAFKLTMNALSRDYNILEDDKTKLQRTMTKVQNSIRGNGIFVSAIDSIEFKLDPARSQMGELKENLQTCIAQLQDLKTSNSMQTELFAHKPSSSEIQSLLTQVQTLGEDISNSRIESIKLGDLYDLSIRIVENGVDHGWQPAVKDVGSEGTAALAKFIIYVGILSHFKDSVFKNSEELHLHCLIDELGRIHADYVSELLDYCRERGIYLASAQPNSHSRPGDFSHTYIVERNSKKQKAKVRPVVQVGVEVG